MVDRFNGDPKLTLDENGADMDFQGGQPVMDSGIENAALISLHTESGWFGNTFFRRPEQQLGSKYLVEANKSITLDQINRIRNAAEFDLGWMLTTNVASSVIASVTNPEAKNINTIVLIEPPAREPAALILTTAGLNWIAQRLDPAYKRLRNGI